MSIVQSIDTLTTAPTRADPTNFDARADALLTGLVTFSGQLNTWTTQANDLADAANLNASNAATSASAAVATAGATVYSGVATYDYPDVVIGSDGHTYRCLGTGVTGDNPVGSVTGDWLCITLNVQVQVNTATGNTTADDGEYYGVDTSGGAVTLTLPASPVAGLSFVGVYDPTGDWSTNNCTVARNGNSIMGLAEDLTCDLAYAGFVLRYVGSANGGWRLFK